MLGCHQVLAYAGLIGTAFVGQAVGLDPVTPKVRGGQRAPPFIGDVTAGENLQPAKLGLPGVEPLDSPAGSGRSHENRTGKDEIDPLPPCSVRHEALAPFVENVTPRVDQAFHEDFGTPGLGPVMPHSTSQKATNAIRGIKVGMNVDRLVEPHHSLGPPTESMHDMVGILGSEARKDDPALIGFAVAIGILQKQDVVAVGHVNTPVTG